MKYNCKACGAVVAVDKNGKVTRACRCGQDTGIVASISAIAFGKGGVATK